MNNTYADIEMKNESIQERLLKRQRFTHFVSEMHRQSVIMPEFKEQLLSMADAANIILRSMHAELTGDLLTAEHVKDDIETATDYEWMQANNEAGYDSKLHFNDAGFFGSEYATYCFYRNARSRDELCRCVVLATNGHVIIVLETDRADSTTRIIKNSEIITELSRTEKLTKQANDT